MDRTIALRGYQQEAVDLIADELNRTGRAHVSLPTGSGKSMVLVELVRRALAGEGPDVPAGAVLVISPRRQITSQLAAAMTASGYGVDSLPASGRVVSAPVVVGTAVSIRRWSQRTAVQPRLMLVDEAHHATADGCRALLDDHLDAHRVGVTATPYRHDGQRLDEVLGRCVYVRDPDHADLATVLAPVVSYVVQLPVDLTEVVSVATAHGYDYRVAQLGTILTTPEAIAATVDGTSDAVVARATVVFAATVRHAVDLAAAYTAAGFRVGCVFGTTRPDDRQRLIAALHAGPGHPDGIDMLVTVGALTEGFDCPPVSALVIARPTRSELLYTQMLGRGLRTHPGKESCVVLDITGEGSVGRPSASGQVLAPTVLPRSGGATPDDDQSAYEGADDDDQRDWYRRVRTVRQLTGTDRKAPAWSWSLGPGGTRQVALSGGRTGVLSPEGVTGLWTPMLLSSDGVTTLAAPLPVRHAVDCFVGMDSYFTRADTRWRTNPPSEKQLALLTRLDPLIAREAVGGLWPSGRVSDLVTALMTTRKLTRVSR